MFDGEITIRQIAEYEFNIETHWTDRDYYRVQVVKEDLNKFTLTMLFDLVERRGRFAETNDTKNEEEAKD